MVTTKDPLVVEIERLQQLLAKPSPDGAREWMNGLRQTLRGIEQALGRQPKPSDKSVQSLELQRREIHPGLTRSAKSLQSDQDSILQEVDVVAGQLEGDAIRPEDVPALRQIGETLVKKLQHFCATKNKLVFDNVMRDTGAGD